MITTNNYFEEIERIGIERLPETLKKSHDFVIKSTNNGKSWDTYQDNQTIRKVIDLYLSKLNEFVNSTQKTAHKTEHPKEIQEKEVAAPRQSVNPSIRKTVSKKQPKPRIETKSDNKPTAKRVEHIREEVKFIKRYVGLHNKVKSPNAILNFIKGLQKAIVQKLIRKTSPLAKEIQLIQDKLVNVYNSMKSDILVEINEKDLSRLVVIAGGEEVYPSINIIKRFIGMQGKEIEDKKKDLFIKQLEAAAKKKKVTRDDPYADRIQAIYKTLRNYKSGPISISESELNGLVGIVKACSCKNNLGMIYNTNGKELRRCKKKTYSDARKGACSHHQGLNGVLTAEQMANRHFERLNFTYLWGSLFGKPAKNFTMMFHGEPGAGKTTLLLKFAEYLANTFGRVLYISSEEHDASTLTDKINELLKPKPDRLEFAPDLETADLSIYDFIIIDSVNDLGLKLEDFKRLRKENPNAAFILILQHTKDGDYRGGKDWEHDIQIAAKVEDGIVTVYRSRYGVKGSIDFFNHFQTKPIQQTQIPLTL